MSSILFCYCCCLTITDTSRIRRVLGCCGLVSAELWKKNSFSPRRISVGHQHDTNIYIITLNCVIFKNIIGVNISMFVSVFVFHLLLLCIEL
jgi:hypothetical protein